MATAKPVEIALLGAGPRGELTLGSVIKRFPKLLRFVAVAETEPARREQFVKQYKIPTENAFSSWEAMMERPQVAEAVINTLPCRLHYPATVKALERGYHVLLEKPIAHSAQECVGLGRLGQMHKKVFMVSLQCRYNDIYREAKDLLDRGTIGPLTNIDCTENLGYYHFSSMFVRGAHSRADHSHSFALAKAIHDVDLVTWFAGAKAKRVSSFGSLAHFTERNAPPGAPKYCVDGCPVDDQCLFNAVREYLKPGRPDVPLSLIRRGASFGLIRDLIREPRFRTLGSLVSTDGTRQSIRDGLRGRYGRCVYRCDNDVVDHQAINIEYENGVTACVGLSGMSMTWERTLDLCGPKGEIRTTDFSGKLETRTFRPAKVRTKRVPFNVLLHGKGDESILLDFAKQVRAGIPGQALGNIGNTIESHLVTLAAEQARVTHQVVEMDDFRAAAGRA